MKRYIKPPPPLPVMLRAQAVLLFLVSSVAVDAFARSSPVAPAAGGSSEGVFSTFLVPIARFSELLMGPLAGIVQSLPVVGPILAPNGSILGFSFGGIIMSTSQALDNALSPIFSGIGGLANGLGGTQATTGVMTAAITTTPSTASST